MKLPVGAGLVALAFVLAACGGHDHGAMTSGDGAASFGEPGDPDDADRTVEVVTNESLRFDPASLDATAGETITFVVTNDTTIPHEFVLGDESYQDSHDEAMEEGMDHEGNGVSLEAGDTQELTWTFSETGEVIYACHVAGHYDAGMKGTVSVE